MKSDKVGPMQAANRTSQLGRGVLFTSFEPSGDDHASEVIAELKRRQPELAIYAWGGPKMERAGARLIERTGENAVMGLPGVGKIIEHIKINRRVKRWLSQGQACLHIPVDSPAANFPICKIAKQEGLRVVHLVAPQMWAWGRWRVKKLRRLTDLVLCLLPFEENWFMSRGVRAKFVGHPLFDRELDMAAVAARARMIEQQIVSECPAIHRKSETNAARGIRLAIMPGSRPAEVEASFPVLLDAFVRLQRDFPNITAVVAATKPSVATRLREIGQQSGGWPKGMITVAGDTDAVVAWCDFAMVVSGTVTLQIAKQSKPMVAMYRPNRWVYHLLGRWLVTTEFFTLPNLIAGRRILPELIPHFGDGEALAVEVIKLMRREGYADDQRAELAKVLRLFEGKSAAVAAVDEIERVLASIAASNMDKTAASQSSHGKA